MPFSASIFWTVIPISFKYGWLRIELLLSGQVQKDNDQLKQVLGYGETPENRKLAKVLNKASLSPQDTLIIDLGEEDINIGDEV